MGLAQINRSSIATVRSLRLGNNIRGPGVGEAEWWAVGWRGLG